MLLPIMVVAQEPAPIQPKAKPKTLKELVAEEKAQKAAEKAAKDAEKKAQEEEIQHLQTGIAQYKDSLRMVTEDAQGMERIAREKYFMKRDNEVVYKIVNKE